MKRERGRERKEGEEEESRQVNNMEIWQLWDNIFKFKHI